MGDIKHIPRAIPGFYKEAPWLEARLSLLLCPRSGVDDKVNKMGQLIQLAVRKSYCVYTFSHLQIDGTRVVTLVSGWCLGQASQSRPQRSRGPHPGGGGQEKVLEASICSSYNHKFRHRFDWYVVGIQQGIYEPDK